MEFDFDLSPTVTYKNGPGLISGNVGRAKKNGFAFEVVGIGAGRLTVDPITGQIQQVRNDVNGGWTITPLSKNGSVYQVRVESWHTQKTVELECLGSDKFNVVKWVHKLPEP